MDALNIQSAVLMGCSIGGRVAIDTALAFPQRVRALVLVAASVSGAPKPDNFPAVIQAKISALESAEARKDLDSVNELEAQLWLDGPAMPAGRVGDKLRELFLDMNAIALRAVDPGEELAGTPAWERLEQIDLATLVAWGTLDFPHLLSRMQEIVRRIPGARGHAIDNAAHLPGLENQWSSMPWYRNSCARYNAARTTFRVPHRPASLQPVP